METIYIYIYIYIYSRIFTRSTEYTNSYPRSYMPIRRWSKFDDYYGYLQFINCKINDSLYQNGISEYIRNFKIKEEVLEILKNIGNRSYNVLLSTFRDAEIFNKSSRW